MNAKLNVSAMLSGIVFVAYGLLFLADLNGAIDLRPSLLWPTLLISWGAVVLARGLRDEPT